MAGLQGGTGTHLERIEPEREFRDETTQLRAGLRWPGLR